MSRPGKTSSRCFIIGGSMDITSSKWPWDGAVLDHEDLAVALDDLRLDLADFLVEKNLVGELAVDDLLANLRDALGTERIGSAGPAEGRLLFLVALEQRLVAPLGREALVGGDRIQSAEHGPAGFGSVGERLLK